MERGIICVPTNDLPGGGSRDDLVFSSSSFFFGRVYSCLQQGTSEASMSEFFRAMCCSGPLSGQAGEFSG